MTDASNDAAPARLADLPLEARRALTTKADRDIQVGLTNRHLAIASEDRAHAAANFATLLRVGPALDAKLRGG